MKSTLLHRRKIPTIDEIEKFRKGNAKVVSAMKDIGSDFRQSVNEVKEGEKDGQSQTYHCRAMIRCYGSMIEGLAVMMREIACNMCELFGEPLNPLLRDKSEERKISLDHRIYTIYRLLAEFAPDSPIAHIPDERWKHLRTAIGIRNRVIHPSCAEDLNVTGDDVRVVFDSGLAFLQDVPAFAHWARVQHERFMWGLGGQRVREGPKVGRNDPCPCNSKKKYKHCCGAKIVARGLG